MYQNDKALVELVARELRNIAQDILDNADNLEDYWNSRQDQYVFPLWSREIRSRREEITEQS